MIGTVCGRGHNRLRIVVHVVAIGAGLMHVHVLLHVLLAVVVVDERMVRRAGGDWRWNLLRV